MKQETLQLTGGAGKDKRRELDFYPTPANVTVALIEFLLEKYALIPIKGVWEPACGDGAMSKVIESYEFLSVFSSDLRYTSYGTGGVDYLKTAIPDGIQAVITNPPFNLSAEFIKKATSEAKLVCMLLKSQYWHARNRYELFKENPPAYVLPLTWRPDFLEHEKKPGEKKGAPTMEVAWSVWIEGDKLTKYIPLVKPK